MSLLNGTLLAARRALAEGEVSPQELAREALDRIKRLNPRLNAFLTVTEPIEELARTTDHGILRGIPIAHKDCFATKGVRTTGGSKILANRVPDHDAEIVTQLAAAGAVTLGKTNLHELCYGITSTNPHFGAVRNPWDLERIPGGSSGGSAAAVAAGMVFAASGTDTGGSIRLPASFCGVVGLKPTYGSISRKGCLPLGITLDHVGPIARTVRDVELVFHAMGGRTPPADILSIAGLQVGVPENYFFDRLTPEVRAAVRHAVQTLAGLGAEPTEIRLDGMEELNTLGRLVLSAEASSLWQKLLAARPRDFGNDVRQALEKGCAVSAADYLEAQRLRRKLSKQLGTLWDGIDCLLTPATPTTAPRIGETSIRIGGVEEDVRAGSTRLVRPFNVLGWPALAMPCGFSKARTGPARPSGRSGTGGGSAERGSVVRANSLEEGLPIGLQLVSAPHREDILFRVGAALEDALGLTARRPALN